MDRTTSLGRSSLQVPRLGVGAMTWGEPSGMARWSPAKLAYGGAHGTAEEKRAFEVSLAGGVTLFDTAEMYSGGASERRLGELAGGHDVLIATKFPPRPFSRTEIMPKELDASLARLGTGFQRICIPGARNGTQAAENAGALTFSLTQAEIEALDNATLAWRG